MAHKLFSFKGIAPRIAVLPMIAVLALFLVNGLNRYYDSLITTADDTSERGAAIALKLTRLLLSESQYLSEANEEDLLRIESLHGEVLKLVAQSRGADNSKGMTTLLDKIEETTGKRERIFHGAQEIVRNIFTTKSLLTAKYRESDHLAENLVGAIDQKAARLILQGEYLSDIKTAYRNILKEFMGFTSAAMLNTNDLLSFSDESRYLTSEADLSRKLKLVTRACDNYSAVTGDPLDRRIWLQIAEKQKSVKELRERLHRLWRLRQGASAKLKATNMAVQQVAQDVTSLAKKEMNDLKRNRMVSESGFIAIVILVLIIFSVLLIRSITRPLVSATKVMADFSMGRLDGLTVPKKSRDDEIGQLIESLRRMIDNNREIVQLARSLAEGNYQVDIQPRSDEDELSESLITMTESLRHFSRQLEQRSEDLERLVSERTMELQTTVQQLEKNIAIRKQAEQALRESEERYRDLVENAVIGFYQVGKEGFFRVVNRKLANIFGFVSPREFLAEFDNVTKLYADPAERPNILREIDARGHIEGKEVRFKGKDGTPVWIKLSTRVTVDGEGSTVYEGMMEDITGHKIMEEEHKHLEDQLQQAYKMEAIGTLAGGIAHDFNNILTPIIIQSELAMMDLDEKNPIRFNLQEVMKAGLRAKELVKQILTFSRQSEQQPIPLKITPIVKEATRLLRSSLPTTIEMRLELKIEEDTVIADPTQIHQVLMNLCTNASHAMRDKGGVLKIELGAVQLDTETSGDISELQPGSYLNLSVSDTGHGISSEVLDRIFDPFFTTKDRSEGTGMGLAVVHGIIKGYGGGITVKSEPGKGTTFNILLPRIEAKASDEPEMTATPPTGNERVLIIDDEEGMVETLKKMLDRLGYQCTKRTSSLDALKLFENSPDLFDLVITDQTMPNITGMELAKLFMSIRSDLPVILCTGFSERVNEQSAKAMGISAFVLKPIVMREIAHTIREVLDNR